MASFQGLHKVLDAMNAPEKQEYEYVTGICITCGDMLEPDSDSDYCRPCLGWAGIDAYHTKAEMYEKD